MSGYVGKLAAGETLAANQFFTGAWRDFSRVQLQPGEDRRWYADTAEYSIFIIAGSGTAQVGNGTQSFDIGAAFTVGYRAHLRLTAGTGLVELFVTTVDVE